jgi:hypothetical protein
MMVMRMALSVLTLILTGVLYTHAQVRLAWAERFGNGFSDYYGGRCMALDGHGHILVAGPQPSTNSVYAADLVTRKFAADGRLLWVHCYMDGGPRNGVTPRSVALDTADHIYITAQVDTLGMSNAAVTFKYNSEGQLLWAKRFSQGGQSFADGAAVSPSGQVYLFGSAQRTNSPGFVGMIWKYTPDGTVDWVRETAANARAMTLDRQENLCLTGFGASIFKYSPNGTLLWLQIAPRCTGWDLAADTQGNLYVGGYADTNGGPLALKYFADGRSAWHRTLPGTGDARQTAIDAQGNIIVGARVAGTTGGESMLLAKYRPDGESLWTRRFDHSLALRFTGMTTDAASSIYLLATLYTNAMRDDTTLVAIKYSAAGELLWQTPYSWPGHRRTSAAGLIVNSRGDIFISGNTAENYNYECLLLKYEQAGPAARLTSHLSLCGEASLSLFAEPGRTYRLETSHDLAAWVSLTNVFNATGTTEVTDANAPPAARRFYRATLVD